MINTHDRLLALESFLDAAQADIPASEAHGIIVGAISNHMKTGQTPNIIQLSNIEVEQNSQLAQALYELYRETGDALLEHYSDFGLLLPSEDVSLSHRVEALSCWCRGYVLGLLYNDAFSIDQLPESGAEIVRDIMQISEAAAGFDTEREEDWALAELEEYVKVGVQLVFESIYSERAQGAPEKLQ